MHEVEIWEDLFEARRGKVLDYLCITFDCTISPKLRVTMDHCIEEILSECGCVVILGRARPVYYYKSGKHRFVT